VMVGALNVGRIRVVGVTPNTSPAPPKRFERGAELARFEMGSTVILVLPATSIAADQGFAGAREGDAVRLGRSLARLARPVTA